MTQNIIQKAQELKVSEDLGEIVEIAKVENYLAEFFAKFSALDKVDKRKLAIAKTNFEQGVLWLMSSLD